MSWPIELIPAQYRMLAGIISAGLLLLALGLAYAAWRSSLIEQGRAAAAAEYEPRIGKLQGRLAEWQSSHQAWQDAHAVLRRQLDQQKAQIAAIDLASRSKVDSLRKSLDRQAASNARLNATARQQADALIALKLPKEKCDAMDAVVRSARGM